MFNYSSTYDVCPDTCVALRRCLRLWQQINMLVLRGERHWSLCNVIAFNNPDSLCCIRWLSPLHDWSSTSLDKHKCNTYSRSHWSSSIKHIGIPKHVFAAFALEWLEISTARSHGNLINYYQHSCLPLVFTYIPHRPSHLVAHTYPSNLSSDPTVITHLALLTNTTHLTLRTAITRRT